MWGDEKDVKHLSDFYEAFRISGCWYRKNGDTDPQITVRGISLYVAIQLYVFQLLAPQLAGCTQSGAFVQYLKRKGLDWHLKMVASRFCSKPMLERSGLRFVALFDTHNNAVVENVAAVSSQLLDDGYSVIAVCSDPKIAKRVPESSATLGYSLYYRLSDELECRQLWNDQVQHISAAVDYLKQMCCQLLGNSIDISVFESYMMNLMKQTIRDIIAMDNLYDELNPDAVILGSDSHKLGRISALLGHKYRWKSLVLQHGAPMLPHAYVPVYADWIAVWGDSFRDWFLKHDVDTGKIVVTGSPRFDGYVCGPNKLLQRKMIWFTTPVSADKVRRCFVALILPVLKSLDVELVIKPHPSEPSTIYAQLASEFGCKRCTVATGVTVKDLVAQGDLVFCLNSTVGIETIALGGLLFVMDIEGVPNTIPYDSYRSVRVLREDSDVVTQVAEFIDYAISDDYLSESKRFIGNYLGLFDGKAAKRVCDFLVNQAR